MLEDERYYACESFVRWLNARVVRSARGDDVDHSESRPSGRFWLGRLAPEAVVLDSGLGERGERLDPCAIGLRLRLSTNDAQHGTVVIRACAWHKERREDAWLKVHLPAVRVPLALDFDAQDESIGADQFRAVCEEAGLGDALAASVDVEYGRRGDGVEVREVTISLVNRSARPDSRSRDTNLYECELRIEGVRTLPFTLRALPDSFRYDRTVPAYGVNCGVEIDESGTIRTVDGPATEVSRPTYWSASQAQPDLRFSVLASDPGGPLHSLLGAYREWHTASWSPEVLYRRARDEGWSDSMRALAAAEAGKAAEELTRLETGLALLDAGTAVGRAFRLMNEAMAEVANRKDYDTWRPFQIGFLLANLECLAGRRDADVADVVWFATGGGKTETYLGLVIMAAFCDRLAGKLSGMSAWSRFPLRMLSLQQTQRFADAMAAAELVRRRHGIGGDPFSVGFFVGTGATPNRIKPEPESDWDPDIEDDAMPARYQVLLRCPFCGSPNIGMAFDRRLWKLEHRCSDDACSWRERALPFYVVDEEIFRFLPTVLVGTLDKAASIAIQTAMRGFVGPPDGVCPREGHGFTYSPRSARPTGCLVPDCREEPAPPPRYEYGPRLRLQDELHLLKDSLGAVDAHYEALYDGLQLDFCSSRAKILASSATLSGFEKQVAVLYRREARVFPVPPPYPGEGFWTARSDRLMRAYVALAPRGVTLEYMVDSLLTELQGAVRWMIEHPAEAAREIEVEAVHVPFLISTYGTDVVYGNTLRDLDAVERSLETQVRVEGAINTATLTGRTAFDEVRRTLDRLEAPEEAFEERLHAITASSMMSHGVDIDRLNVMCMLGLPLTTSEFIQSTARVGRTWPGIVFVAFKMARERDASMFRLFDKYVTHGDRFVEAVPVTRRSRRVLDRTLPGLFLARVLMEHERAAGRALTTVRALREYVAAGGIAPEHEMEVLARYLELEGPLDEGLRADLAEWLELYFRALEQPGPEARFPSDLCPRRGPMLSLRDVEEQVPVHLPRWR